jgi:PAS domain S-box-containing protein
VENKLREAEKRYHAFFDKAPLGILIIDTDGTAVEFNDQAHLQLGYSREEFEKVTVVDYDLLETPDEVKAHMKRILKLGKDEFEGKYRTKTGEIIILKSAVQVIELDGKKFFHVINQNITEQKKAQEFLDKMMKELLLTNEKLSVVGKLSRHDARNKLSIIANNIYLAKKQLVKDNKTSDYLKSIESAIDQIEKIFSFATIYEKVGAEDLSYVNVESCFNEAALLFSEMSDVKLVNDCSGLNVLADSLLQQLFYNLIDDSLKHGETVSQIRVNYETEDDNLKLVYTDDGTGVPEKEKELIFKEGYGKGTGYGLYLIRKLCDAYGWTIKETGTSGKGAQFTIAIPKVDTNNRLSYSISGSSEQQR